MSQVVKCVVPSILDLGVFNPCSKVSLYPLVACQNGVYRLKYFNRYADQWIESSVKKGDVISFPQGKINESYKGVIKIYNPDGTNYKSDQYYKASESSEAQLICFSKFKLEMRFGFINRDLKEINDLIFATTDDKKIGEIHIDELIK